MKSTIKKVVVQPKQEEITRDVVVLEMSKREAAALYVLWHTSAGFPVALSSLSGVLGFKPMVLEGDAYDKRKFSDYKVTVTREGREWVNSFDDNSEV
jgi:hypothetical protein